MTRPFKLDATKEQVLRCQRKKIQFIICLFRRIAQYNNSHVMLREYEIH